MTDYSDYRLKKFNSELTSDIQAKINTLNELENEKSIFDTNNGQKAEVSHSSESDTNKDDKFNEEEVKNISAQIAEINAQADKVTGQITGFEASAQNHDTQAASHHSKAAELRSQAANVPLKPETKTVNGVATTTYVKDTAKINALLNQAKAEEEAAKKEEQQAKEDRKQAADLANEQKEYFEKAKELEQDLKAYEDENGSLKDELTDDKEKEEYEKQRKVLDDKITDAKKEVDSAIAKAAEEEKKEKAEEEKVKEENEKNKQKEDNTLQPEVDNQPEEAIYLDDPSQNIVNKHPLGEENKQAYQLGDKRYYIDPKTGDQSIYQYDESNGYIPIAKTKRTENGVEIIDRNTNTMTTVTDDGKIETKQMEPIAAGGGRNAKKPGVMAIRSDLNSNNMTVALNDNSNADSAATGANDNDTNTDNENAATGANNDASTSDSADDTATDTDTDKKTGATDSAAAGAGAEETDAAKETEEENKTDNTSTDKTEGEEKTDTDKEDTDKAEEKNDAGTEEANDIESSMPEELKEYKITGNPDDEYKLKQQSEGKYSVAGVDNLTPNDSDFDINNIDSYGENNKCEFTDEDGKEVFLWVEKDDSGKVTEYHVTQQTDSGLTESVYSPNENKIDVTNYNDGGIPESGCTIMYNDSGTAKYWEQQYVIERDKNNKPLEIKYNTPDGNDFIYKTESEKFFDSEGKEYASKEDAIPSYQKAMQGDTSTDDSDDSNSMFDRNDEKRAAIKNYEELSEGEVENNHGKGIDAGVKFDLDVFHDKYVDDKHQYNGKKRDDAIDEYKTKVAEDINATLKARYSNENLADVYEKIAKNNISLDLPKREDYKDKDNEYIKEMSLKLAEISWDLDYKNDFLEMDEVDEAFGIEKTTVTDAVEVNVTDATEDADKADAEDADTTDGTDGAGDTDGANGSDKSGKTDTKDSDETAEEVTAPKPVTLKEGETIDKHFGINENEDNTYTIAGVEGLTPADNEDCLNLEDGEEHYFKTVNGNNVKVEVKTETNGDKTYTVIVENDDSTTTTTEYCAVINKQTIIEKDENNKKTKLNRTVYEDDGTVVSWTDRKYTTNEAGDTICIVTDSETGPYKRVSRKGTHAYYDKDGKYEFETVKDAGKASEIIELYKNAGIDELTPSQKLILGEDKTLDALMKDIENTDVDKVKKIIEDNQDLIETVKNPSENEKIKELSENDKKQLTEAMEYYDMIMGVYDNLSDTTKNTITPKIKDFETYFNKILTGEYSSSAFNTAILQQYSKLKDICKTLKIARTSETDDYDTGIEYTASYQDQGKKYTYDVEETINTKKGSINKTRTTITDDGTIRTYEYENGKCIRKTEETKDSAGNVTKTVSDRYHEVGKKQSSRTIKIEYNNGEPSKVTINGEEYTINADKISNGTTEISKTDPIYQYVFGSNTNENSDENSENNTDQVTDENTDESEKDDLEEDDAE